MKFQAIMHEKCREALGLPSCSFLPTFTSSIYFAGISLFSSSLLCVLQGILMAKNLVTFLFQLIGG